MDNRFNRTGNGYGIHSDLPEVINWQEKLKRYSYERNISMAISLLETAWMDALLIQYPNHPFFFFYRGSVGLFF